ncbi:methylenetetrahydrofolate dehydrogenase (NADP+)/methenyltetrahydrofolate cyclohydrolase [Mycoplasma testudineum]|uniref:Bifunctional protein FolD n=1 Tax=Mycoplasma testudineum TaxID=244584 RepID=A0A4R6IC45_9MOLU|nr:bifunctional 5,10-methylenetetrahydrofolate dehydrogenase/5,10-methenyltetrahydrofolate cyclohydrolase [Mycoplasma testudineum]OYD26572.1 bifunctional 5,10-methylene-tetrahydrofolate dehydrogenase/5,10-methylene-tetrahydrofolate cyclohydrolase [Mycoplasma testudineum]TDO19404.1 methylenetetrahydrofolate dehydrogenase (NADP+)/methenyltetrahydrofolate cyclohydrolase [Mycoplasma testudineum]
MIKLTSKIMAVELKENLKSEIEKLKSKPKLAIVLVGQNPSSLVYVNAKLKMAEEIGVSGHLINFDEFVTQDEIIKSISKLNESMDGIIIQLPLPNHLDRVKILNSVDQFKDTDGLGDKNQNSIILNQNEYFIKPATAQAILLFMDYHKIDYKNLSVGIVGKSRLIGKPLFHILSKINEKVTVFDKSTTINGTEKCDILIVATGVINLIKQQNIKKGAILIDAGFTKIDNKTFGDVDLDSVKDKASAIAPPLGSIGPITVLSLFSNLIESIKNKKNNYK